MGSTLSWIQNTHVMRQDYLRSLFDFSLHNTSNIIILPIPIHTLLWLFECLLFCVGVAAQSVASSTVQCGFLTKHFIHNTLEIHTKKNMR
jgi:hypothetical protein